MGSPNTAGQATKAHARNAANSDWVERLGSLGFAAKGLLYLTIAALAGSVGFTSGGEASQTGAIQQLSEATYGTVILVVLAVGLAGYSLLRLLHVFVNPSDEDGAKGAVMRISYLIRAIIYGGLTVFTISILTGGSSGGGGGGGGGGGQQLTGRVLQWPGGQLIIGAVALVLFGIAAFQLKKAFTQEFMDQVHAAGTKRTVTKWAGVIGHAARAVLFATIGVLLGRAALQSDASESGGLSQAFQELGSTAFGTSLLTAIAIGVAGYGLFCLAMAAWGSARRAG